MLGAATIGALSPFAVAATPPRRPPNSLELGFSLYGMPGIGIELAIGTCAETGYTNVELALLPGFPTAPELLTSRVMANVQRALATSHLRVSSLLVSMSLVGSEERHEQSMEILRLAARVAGELGQVEPPVIQTVFGGKPEDRSSHYPDMVKRLREWDKVAAEKAVTVAVKAHVGTSIRTPGELLTLLRKAETTHIAVDFDQSHYALAGLPVSESLPPLAALTRFVHLKDARGKAPDHEFLLPGVGSTNYRELFAALRHFHYRGPVVVEVSRQIFSVPSYDPVATVRDCYRRLAPILVE